MIKPKYNFLECCIGLKSEKSSIKHYTVSIWAYDFVEDLILLDESTFNSISECQEHYRKYLQDYIR